MRLFEEITTFLSMVIKFPLRLICKFKGHNLWYYGGGWIFTSKYAFVCKRCGIRSRGTYDDMAKKGLNPKGARIN